MYEEAEPERNSNAVTPGRRASSYPAPNSTRVISYIVDMGEQDAITRPARRSLQRPLEHRPPLATARGGRDPSDATLAVNEKTMRLGAGRTVLLGRSSQREVVGDGVVKDGGKIIVDVTSGS